MAFAHTIGLNNLFFYRGEDAPVILFIIARTQHLRLVSLYFKLSASPKCPLFDHHYISHHVAELCWVFYPFFLFP